MFLFQYATHCFMCFVGFFSNLCCVRLFIVYNFFYIFLDKRLRFSCIFIKLCIPLCHNLYDQRYIFKGCFRSVDMRVDLCVLRMFEGQLTGLCSV